MVSVPGHNYRRSGPTSSITTTVFFVAAVLVLGIYCWSLSSENKSLRTTMLHTYTKLRQIANLKMNLEKRNTVLSNRMVEMEEQRDSAKETRDQEKASRESCEIKLSTKDEAIELTNNKLKKILDEVYPDRKQGDPEEEDRIDNKDINIGLIIQKIKDIKASLASVRQDYMLLQNKYAILDKENADLKHDKTVNMKKLTLDIKATKPLPQHVVAPTFEASSEEDGAGTDPNENNSREMEQEEETEDGVKISTTAATTTYSKKQIKTKNEIEPSNKSKVDNRKHSHLKIGKRKIRKQRNPDQIVPGIPGETTHQLEKVTTFKNDQSKTVPPEDSNNKKKEHLLPEKAIVRKVQVNTFTTAKRINAQLARQDIMKKIEKKQREHVSLPHGNTKQTEEEEEEEENGAAGHIGKTAEEAEHGRDMHGRKGTGDMEDNDVQ